MASRSPADSRASHSWRSWSQVNSWLFFSRVVAPSSALRSGSVMPFSAAAFSICVVRREKRLSSAGEMPAISKSSRLRWMGRPKSCSLLARRTRKAAWKYGASRFELAELAGLPALLLAVVRRVERETVGVQVRVGHAVDGPRRGVDEFGPEHVAGGAVVILAVDTHPGLHLGLDVAHGLIDGGAEGGEDFRVVAEAVEQRHRLGHREGEVVADGAVGARAGRQRIVVVRLQVVAQPVEGVLVDHAGEAQAACPLPPPQADELLALAEIIGLAVITLGALGATLLGHAKHASFYARQVPSGWIRLLI